MSRKHIRQIFDGEYGCEENTSDRSEPMMSVTLEDESGEISYETVADSWLRENNLDVGSEWPETIHKVFPMNKTSVS